MPSNRCSGKVCRGFTCDRSGSAAPQVDISDDKRDANNNDAWKLLEVNATCFVDFTCPTCACDCQDRKKRAVAAVGEEGELLKKFDRVRRAAGCLCSKNVPCSTCSVSNTAMFEVKNGKEIWRKPCSTKCRDCSGQPGCFDNGETYKTTVTCSAAGYDVNDEVELPEEVVLLVRSVDPPAVAFPESDGTVTARWLDPVGTILATPDFEFPERTGAVEFTLTGTISTTSGEELFALNETSGSIEVISDLSLEASADYNLTLCVETRRHNVCAFLDRHYCTPVHPWSTVIGMAAWCDWTCNDPEWKNVTCLNSYCACVPPVFTISEAAP
ncbi:hypothetical protein MAR_019172 [Mya arenaria]|uniref:Uncharacterized protein n=1 Tax=Mya arenaria TaxID=6604 RepID=A0ABY7ELG4_MYAAR|nr:hypothetical protein MAR_019172 [Mya arenaria]